MRTIFPFRSTSLGGDPFPTAQFTISKNKLYDFRVDWRQSYYFWNQNDNVVLPIAAVAPGISKGLDHNHDWATVRKFGSVDFTLHATNNLRFRFNYYRPSDEGTTFTTRSLDFFDSPSLLGNVCAGESVLSVRPSRRLHQPVYRRIRLHAEGLELSLQHRLSDVHRKYQPEQCDVPPNSASIRLPVPLPNP